MSNLELLRKCLELVDELEENLLQLRLKSRVSDELDNLRSEIESQLGLKENEAAIALAAAVQDDN